MRTTNRNSQFFAWLSIFLCVCYYIVILCLNQVPHDEGDGLQHFFIARDSWSDPALFVHHWGKPFFILFSSGFAQFGFEGYICFNILVFALSCVVVNSILNHYQSPTLIQFLFPFVLISIPDYSNCVISGLTEPFFGLLLLLLFWLLIKERYLWFAIICSFTPFARSEGMLVVLAAVPLLLLLRQWKYIPLLMEGFVIYLLAGWILISQPLWYFENNPYSPESVYGSGPWDTYLLSIFQHLGLIPILLLPFMLLGLFIWKANGKRKDLLLILFFGGLYISIIFIHSYLWAKGLRGALGLSRLATLGLVPFLTIQAVAVGYVFRELHKMSHAFFAIVVLFLVGKNLRESALPTVANLQQLSLKTASAYLQQHEKQVGTIYYFHPLIVYFRSGESPQYQQRFIHLDDDIRKNLFKPGDLIVRDSKFGPTEQGLHFDELEKYPWIVPIKHFYTTDATPELNGESKSVIIYQVMNKKTFNRQEWNNTQTIVRKKELQLNIKESANVEFHNIDTLSVPALSGARQELKATVRFKGEDPVFLIFDNRKGYYVSIPVTKETSDISIPFVEGNMTGLLFIHNPSKKPYEFYFHTKSWTQTLDSGIQTVK